MHLYHTQLYVAIIIQISTRKHPIFSSTHIRFCMLLTALLFSIENMNLAHAVGGDSTDGEWKYSLSPLFLWAQGIQGSSQIGPVSAPLDITFKDALSNLEMTFTVHFEMKKDRLTLFGEYQ